MNYQAVKIEVLSKLRGGLSNQLFYHNIEHTLCVMQSTEELTSSMDFNEVEVELMLTAALFHDTGYLYQYDDNEEIGARVAQEILRGFNYTPDQIDQICRIICDTSIKVSCTNLMSEVVRDADLSYLGTSGYVPIAELLREEFSAYGRDFSDEEWLSLQINFLESHQFYTSAAIDLYEENKQLNLKLLIERKEGACE